MDGLRGEDSIAELCRREGISQGTDYKWSKDFMEAEKKRLAGDMARSANTDEVKDLRREARDLKEVVTEQTYYRWRKEYGGMGVDQAKRLKDLEKENQRLRQAVSDLTIDKQILAEAAKGNF